MSFAGVTPEPQFYEFDWTPVNETANRRELTTILVVLVRQTKVAKVNQQEYIWETHDVGFYLLFPQLGLIIALIFEMIVFLTIVSRKWLYLFYTQNIGVFLYVHALCYLV